MDLSALYNCSVSCFLLFSETIHYLTLTQGELNRRRGRQSFSTLCWDVFGLLENQFLRNNNNKGSRSNVNKHELIYGESSSNTPEMHLMYVYHLYYCLQSLLLLLRKTSSPAVQKRHSKVYGNPIAPSLYSILLAWMYHKEIKNNKC